MEKFNISASRMTLAVLAGCVVMAVLGAALPAAASAAAQRRCRASARRRRPRASAHVKSLSGIDEYRLDSNGLTVLLVPDHSAPVVTFQVTYQVGSRNEVTGHHGRDAHPRTHDVQGKRGLQRSQGQQRQAISGARRRPVQCQHLVRPHQLLRHHRPREPGRLYRHRGRPHAPSVAA